MSTDHIKTLNFWFITFIFGCILILYHLTNVSQVDIFLKSTPIGFDYYSIKFNFYFGLYFILVPLFYILLHGTSLYVIGNFILFIKSPDNVCKEELYYSPFIFIIRYINPKVTKNITDFVSLSFIYLIFYILPPLLLSWFYWYFSKYQSWELTLIHLSLILADLFIVVTYGSTLLNFFDTHLRSNSLRWSTFPPKHPNFKRFDNSFKRNIFVLIGQELFLLQ